MFRGLLGKKRIVRDYGVSTVRTAWTLFRKRRKSKLPKKDDEFVYLNNIENVKIKQTENAKHTNATGAIHAAKPQVKSQPNAQLEFQEVWPKAKPPFKPFPEVTTRVDSSSTKSVVGKIENVKTSETDNAKPTDAAKPRTKANAQQQVQDAPQAKPAIKPFAVETAREDIRERHTGWSLRKKRVINPFAEKTAHVDSSTTSAVGKHEKVQTDETEKAKTTGAVKPETKRQVQQNVPGAQAKPVIKPFADKTTHVDSSATSTFGKMEKFKTDETEKAKATGAAKPETKRQVQQNVQDAHTKPVIKPFADKTTRVDSSTTSAFGKIEIVKTDETEKAKATGAAKPETKRQVQQNVQDAQTKPVIKPFAEKTAGVDSSTTSAFDKIKKFKTDETEKAKTTGAAKPQTKHQVQQNVQDAQAKPVIKPFAEQTARVDSSTTSAYDKINKFKTDETEKANTTGAAKPETKRQVQQNVQDAHTKPVIKPFADKTTRVDSSTTSAFGKIEIVKTDETEKAKTTGAAKQETKRQVEQNVQDAQTKPVINPYPYKTKGVDSSITTPAFDKIEKFKTDETEKAKTTGAAKPGTKRQVQRNVQDAHTKPVIKPFAEKTARVDSSTTTSAFDKIEKFKTDETEKAKTTGAAKQETKRQVEQNVQDAQTKPVINPYPYKTKGVDSSITTPAFDKIEKFKTDETEKAKTTGAAKPGTKRQVQRNVQDAHTKPVIKPVAEKTARVDSSTTTSAFDKIKKFKTDETEKAKTTGAAKQETKRQVEQNVQDAQTKPVINPYPYKTKGVDSSITTPAFDKIEKFKTDETEKAKTTGAAKPGTKRQVQRNVQDAHTKPVIKPFAEKTARVDSSTTTSAFDKIKKFKTDETEKAKTTGAAKQETKRQVEQNVQDAQTKPVINPYPYKTKGVDSSITTPAFDKIEKFKTDETEKAKTTGAAKPGTKRQVQRNVQDAQTKPVIKPFAEKTAGVDSSTTSADKIKKIKPDETEKAKTTGAAKPDTKRQIQQNVQDAHTKPVIKPFAEKTARVDSSTTTSAFDKIEKFKTDETEKSKTTGAAKSETKRQIQQNVQDAQAKPVIKPFADKTKRVDSSTTSAVGKIETVKTDETEKTKTTGAAKPETKRQVQQNFQDAQAKPVIKPFADKIAQQLYPKSQPKVVSKPFVEETARVDSSTTSAVGNIEIVKTDETVKAKTAGATQPETKRQVQQNVQDAQTKPVIKPFAEQTAHVDNSITSSVGKHEKNKTDETEKAKTTGAAKPETKHQVQQNVQDAHAKPVIKPFAEKMAEELYPKSRPKVVSKPFVEETARVDSSTTLAVGKIEIVKTDEREKAKTTGAGKLQTKDQVQQNAQNTQPKPIIKPFATATDTAKPKGKATQPEVKDQVEVEQKEAQPSPKPVILPFQEVTAFINNCMAAVGTKPEHAAQLAEVLIDADYRGHFSHGLNRLGKLAGVQRRHYLCHFSN